MTNEPFTVHRVVKMRERALPPHVHEEGQLTFLTAGTAQIRTDRGVWLMPPQIATWVPPNAEHSLELLTEVEMLILLIPPATLYRWQAQAPSLDTVFALRMTPLLRELLLLATAPHTEMESADLAARLILRELTVVEAARTFLPFPTSEVGRRIASLVLEDRANRHSLDDLARRGASSVRTVSRLFPVETGMTFKAWRQRARIIRSMESLGSGKSIAAVATEAGFASTAAYSAAFRQVTAQTPMAFMDPR